MDRMTLREVCAHAGVTRRAVQGYEEAGLVYRSGKNERGYLLYDTYAFERIEQIKLYQQFGFTIREIQTIIDAPNPVLKQALEEKVLCMKQEEERFQALIEKANELISRL